MASLLLIHDGRTYLCSHRIQIDELAKTCEIETIIRDEGKRNFTFYVNEGKALFAVTYRDVFVERI